MMTAAGTLHVITGPMFSGKTERLLRLTERARAAGQPCALIKPAIDNRHATSLVISHGGRWEAARPATDEQAIFQLVGRSRVVAIDEVQFFEPGIVDVISKLRGQGLVVAAAGLDLDFLGRPFGPMLSLADVADELTTLTAICHKCGAPAQFTQRLLNGQPVIVDEPLVKIGGAGMYEARCAACYLKGAPKAA